MPSPTGIDRNLTHYADPGFSRYLRRAFLASAGYDEADLDKRIRLYWQNSGTSPQVSVTSRILSLTSCTKVPSLSSWAASFASHV